MRAVLGLAAIGALGMLVAAAAAGEASWPLALGVLAAGAFAALIAMMLVLPRLRRLHAATAAAEALARGDAAPPLDAGSDEFTPLARALNAAAASTVATAGAMRQQVEQLEAMLNASSDATVAVEAGGRIVYMNDAGRQLFSARENTDGRPFIEVVRDHDVDALVIAAARERERSVRVVAYGPSQRWLQVTAVPITGGGQWAALAIFHDLTEVRRLDSVRRTFISNVSHELRTPLAGIRAAAETLAEGAIEDPPAASEFLGHIQRETDRLTQLVEELLELSRIESGAAPMTFAPVDAASLVEDTVARFSQQAERSGLRITSEVPAEPLTLIGDAERIERALGNLVANAIKFTDPGGSITVGARAAGGDVALSVRDTGAGIDALEQERVFERFYKADRGRGSGGTGLGLAIVKHIARAHGGTAGVQSRLGEGSTFTITLPRR